jgi:hypothetical protein
MDRPLAVVARLSAWGRLDRRRQARWRRQRERPPRCPPGWHTAPPDFVGVGVAKAGTTWWYHLITRHPDVVHRGHPKELHFFRAPHPGDYARWFPRPAGKVAGEWTPTYLGSPVEIERLRATAPAARILVMLRDPVDRYVSRLTMATVRGWPDPVPTSETQGFYARQLEQLFTQYERSHVLVLQYERCVAATAAELAGTYRFLGLRDDVRPAFMQRPVHETIAPKVVLDPDERRRIVDLYAEDVARLPALVPDLDLSLWPHYA